MVAFPSSATLIVVLLLITIQVSMLAMAENVLYAGERLNADEALTYGRYNFIMQQDCNLVLYDNGNVIWSTGTYGQATGCNLRMQNDGNLVIYSGRNEVVWASNSVSGTGNYVLLLQKDRNVVIYGGARWATNTE